MELAREDRDEILDRSGEYGYGRSDIYDGVWGVAIGEYGSLEAVAVKFAIGFMVLTPIYQFLHGNCRVGMRQSIVGGERPSQSGTSWYLTP